jgi:hypothetical protein
MLQLTIEFNINPPKETIRGIDGVLAWTPDREQRRRAQTGAIDSSRHHSPVR